MKTVTERASAYLARMPASVSGQRGHATAFSAAVALVRGFDLSEQEALPLLSRWNDACLPPWKENELRHKLRSAATTAGRPPGYLLTQSASSQPIPHPTMPAAAEDRAWLRETWPEFHPLTHEDIRAVARLRGIFPDAVDLAHRHGFLRVAEVQGHRCLVITEGAFAQVRRLDGEPLVKADGTRIKARNLSGSQGAFLGQRWLGESTHVLLVEGAIGLIEGLAAMLLVDTPHAWSILAATSASSRFARDSALLAQLKGRRVLIVPDADEAGKDAAASLQADLRAHGASADSLRLPAGIKDLGELLQTETSLSTLQRIFS